MNKHKFYQDPSNMIGTYYGHMSKMNLVKRVQTTSKDFTITNGDKNFTHKHSHITASSDTSKLSHPDALGLKGKQK